MLSLTEPVAAVSLLIRAAPAIMAIRAKSDAIWHEFFLAVPDAEQVLAALEEAGIVQAESGAWYVQEAALADLLDALPYLLKEL